LLLNGVSKHKHETSQLRSASDEALESVFVDLADRALEGGLWPRAEVAADLAPPDRDLSLEQDELVLVGFGHLWLSRGFPLAALSSSVEGW
jgi:hypothetical protein